MLVVPGRPRSIGAVIGGIVVALVIASRLLLGIDHPFDILVALAFGVAVPLMAFRWFTPNSVVPVRYSRGKTAHLDVPGGAARPSAAPSRSSSASASSTSSRSGSPARAVRRRCA